LGIYVQVFGHGNRMRSSTIVMRYCKCLCCSFHIKL
jgi:hypothetical protein